VLVVMLAVVAAACGGGDEPSVGVGQTDSTTTSSSAAPVDSTTTTSTTAPLPPGTIRSRGLQFTVPTDWPVHDLTAEPTTCARADVHAVYLGTQGPDAQCPARGIGITENLQIAPVDERSQIAAAQATKATTINGLTARVDPDPDLNGALTAVFPDQGVVVILRFGSARSVVDQILASVVAAP